MQIKRKLFIIALIPSLMFYISLGFAAGAVDVSPIRIVFSKTEHIASLKLTNNTNDVFAAKIIAKKWTRKNEVDKYEATNDILLTPQTTSIPPNQSQILRVGLVTPPTNIEKAYRLFITQLPEPIKSAKNQQQIVISFEFLVPVYVTPIAEVHKMNWDITKKPFNKVNIKLTNSGNVHVSVNSLQIQDPVTKKVIGTYNKGLTIFAGQSETIPIKLIEPAPKQILLNADTSFGNITEVKSVS